MVKILKLALFCGLFISQETVNEYSPGKNKMVILFTVRKASCMYLNYKELSDPLNFNIHYKFCSFVSLIGCSSNERS